MSTSLPIWRIVAGSLLLALLWAGPTHAAQEGDFLYEPGPDGATVTGLWGDPPEVTIPDTLGGQPVTAVGAMAFFSKDTSRITLSPTVKSIGSMAFFYCQYLSSVIIPHGVTAIDAGTFDGCTSLTNVTIPDGVTVIGLSSFSGCRSLKNVSLPETVTTISNQAFEFCTNLTRIEIPNAVTSIGDGAFARCTSLSAIEVAPLNGAYSSVDGILFTKDRTSLVRFPGRKAGTYDVPESVTSIGTGAFESCQNLARVTIPHGVTNIGAGAFSGCQSLTTILIPGGVTSIGDNTFANCTSLTGVSVLGGIGSIGRAAFLGCTCLPSVALPSSVTAINGAAFSGCTSLAGLFFEGSPPSAIGGDLFKLPAVTAVYHRAETVGWGKTFAGLPTTVWVPLPEYGPWALAAGLPTLHPEASAPDDDPDGDGFTNVEELQAATDPTDPGSRLVIELVARPGDLSAADQTPVPADKHAVYFRSIPGKTYGLVTFQALGGNKAPVDDRSPAPSQPVLLAVVTATHPQTRLMVAQPSSTHGLPATAFYRVFALAEQGIAPIPVPPF